MDCNPDFVDSHNHREQEGHRALWPSPPPDAATLKLDATVTGTVWEDDLGRFCLVRNVFSDKTLSSELQLNALFDRFDVLLGRAGFHFSEVIRTWFFLEDILAVYADFNRIRTSFFRKRGMLGQAPASTAVGCGNRQHAVAQAHLLAFRPRATGASIAIAESPLQSSALDYGSTFSRGVTVEGPRRKRLYLSGTASIDREGKTLHPSNFDAQVQETFEVVSAMLAHHHYRLQDVLVANAYIPPGQNFDTARRLWAQHLNLPFSCLEASICRSDLDFELELIAEKSPC